MNSAGRAALMGAALVLSVLGFVDHGLPDRASPVGAVAHGEADLLIPGVAAGVVPARLPDLPGTIVLDWLTGAEDDLDGIVLDQIRAIDQEACRVRHCLTPVDLHPRLRAGIFGTAFVDRLDGPIHPADEQRGDRDHSREPEECVH